MTSTSRFDAIVVGAGLVGAACADALAAEGLRVLVLEERFPAAGTTAAGMGHLTVMDDSSEQLGLTRYGVQLWRERDGELPRAAELEWCGTIWVAADDEEMEAVRAKQRLHAEHGIASEILDAAAVAEAEPYLRRGLAGGLLVPGDGVIYQPVATRALLAAAERRGGVVRSGARVERIVQHGVVCDGERLGADIVVNAAGASAARLVPELPVVPRKGHLAITDRYPGLCRHQLVELGYLKSAHAMTTESVAFNLQPRITGQVLIGSSRELVGWDASTNHRLLGEMLRRARSFVPALDRVSILRTWTGFRPATPDKLPLIGEWPAVPGLWIAAGHEGLGITTSLVTARLLADRIAGRASAIDQTPFLPARVLHAAGVA